MKLVFCYTLPLVLATSSLVAGPKPFIERKPGSPETSVEQQTEISRRKTDSLAPRDGTDDDPALQARNPDAAASIAERISSEDLFELDSSQNSGQNGAIESTHISSRLEASIIEDYILEESSGESKSADGRMALVSRSTTRDLDQQRGLLKQNITAVKTAHAAFQEQTQKTAKSPGFVVKSTIASMTPCVKPPSSKKLSEKIAEVEEAQYYLNAVVTQFGAESTEELLNQITEETGKINVFNAEQGVREKAPMAQSFKFGILIRQELQQLQQKTITDKLAGKVGEFGKSNPFGDMLADLDRTHGRDNIRFSLINGRTTTLLNQENGQANLATFRNFARKNTLEQVQPMEVAIASVMHQAGQSDFESLKLGAPRDSTEAASLPFFTEGVHEQMWRHDMAGPIFMKLFNGANKTESQSYDLQKITNEDQPPVFKLIITCTQSIKDPDFDYALTRDVTYQFEENRSFNSRYCISEKNAPVTIKCLEGKIIQSFEDKRTPEAFNHQAAQYNLTVYQRRLDELGDPGQIETTYRNRIAFLASKATSRPGSIMTQDRNVAEAKLQQLRKAQQDVARAQQEATDSQRRLTALPGDDHDDGVPEFAVDDK